MHNDTPLGTTMHLKELDRKATPTLDPSRAGGRGFHLTTVIIRRAMTSLLRRLHGAGIPVRVVSRG